MSGLERYSSDDLLQELHRRETEREAKRERQTPIRRWCDDCVHFRYWRARSEPPPEYNPCQKKHEMSFRMPAEEDGPQPDPSTWGYYRRNCWSFKSRPVAPPPPPPQTLEESHADAARDARKVRGGKVFTLRTIPGQVTDPKTTK